MSDIDGFESAYGLELLATVHWVVAHDQDARDDAEKTHEQVRRWSTRKSNLFTPNHVEVAWRTLKERELVRAS